MKSPNPIIRCITILGSISIIILQAATTTHASSITHHMNYNNNAHNSEYCYTESFTMGTCLGKDQLNSLDNPMSDAQILQCLECSGKFRGDETCEELKALNDVEEVFGTKKISNSVTTQDGNTNGDNTENNKGENNENEGNDNQEIINWHESFCETYNICVQTNCPQVCHKEQEAWIECLIIELDCDWRCNPGSDDNNMMEGRAKQKMMYTYNSSGDSSRLRWGRRDGMIVFLGMTMLQLLFVGNF